MNLKNIYSSLVIISILTIPYIDYQTFPYSASLWGYGLGFLLVPVIFAGISKLFKGSFQNWFNGVGTLVFIGHIAQALTSVP